MSVKPIADFLEGPRFDYFTSILQDHNIRLLQTTEEYAGRLLISLFDDVNWRNNSWGLLNPFLRSLTKIGAVNAADYAKNILDAHSTGVLTSDITRIAIKALSSFSLVDEDLIMTERLLGKRRMSSWLQLQNTYSIDFIEPVPFALMALWGNNDETLNEFLKENRSRINELISSMMDI